MPSRDGLILSSLASGAVDTCSVDGSCMLIGCQGLLSFCADLWVNLWTQLLTDIVSDPPSAQRVMVDILNEPDAKAIG